MILLCVGTDTLVSKFGVGAGAGARNQVFYKHLNEEALGKNIQVCASRKIPKKMRYRR